jgi:hypothetical protein
MDVTEKMIPRVTEFQHFGGIVDKIPTGTVFAHFNNGGNGNADRYVYDPNFSMSDCVQWFVRCERGNLTAWQAVTRA